MYGQGDKFQAGIEGGPGVCFIYWVKNYWTTSDAAAGFTTSAFFQWNITQRFALRPGLAFEQKGSTDTYQDYFGEVFQSRLRSRWIALPVLARFSFGKKIRFFIDSGPYVGYALQLQSFYSNSASSTEFESDYTRSGHRFDAGLCLGIGIAFPISKNLGLSIEARDNLGLVKAEASQRYNATYLMAGVCYSWGGKQ